MTEYRCRHCNALLFKARLFVAGIEIKCYRTACRRINVFDEGKVLV